MSRVGSSRQGTSLGGVSLGACPWGVSPPALTSPPTRGGGQLPVCSGLSSWRGSSPSSCQEQHTGGPFLQDSPPYLLYRTTRYS